jgi:ankyrin repeat protein
MERTPPALKLATACDLGDRALVDATLSAHPGVLSTLTDDERRRLPIAARNDNTEAVRLMLAVGWPVDTRDRQGATALHWAGWHGNAEMARDILGYKPALELDDDEHHARPLGWTIHGSLHGWHCRTGDYGATLEALLEAGAVHPTASEDFEGSDAVRDVLRRWTQNPLR